jgi:DNA-binding NtrC family response regulator
VLLARKPMLSDADLQLPGMKSRYQRGTDATKTVAPVIAAVPAAAPAPVVPTADTFDLRSALENLERDMIAKALDKAGGNRTEAAALLGLNRTTLVEKLRKYAA